MLRDDQQPSAYFLADIAALPDRVPDAAAVGIDIPIGLLDRGHRRADAAAKAVLGRRRNSVFMTPVRAALEAPSHAVATAIARETTGAGISQQSFALRSKIFQVEEWLPRAPCPVFEVHPEVSFTLMTGHPAGATKKSWHGLVERRAALDAAGISLDGVDPAVGAVVGVDDMIDAAAVAWTASRLIAGVARPHPDPPEIDPSGRQIAIWA